jgi:hypothetical protein
MSEIRTYNDLLEEKKRLEAVLVIQKRIIHEDLIELREEIRPALNLLSIVGKITNRNSSNPLIGIGAGLVADVFLKGMVLSRTAKITQLIVPFLANKVSAYFDNRKGGTIFQKLASVWKKHKSNGHAVN